MFAWGLNVIELMQFKTLCSNLSHFIAKGVFNVIKHLLKAHIYD